MTDTDLDHPGRFVARAHTETHHGGTYLPGALFAGTLPELRAQMPMGLSLREQTALLPSHVIETWA